MSKELNFLKYNDEFIEGCGRNAQEWGREGDRSLTMLPAPPRPVDRNSWVGWVGCSTEGSWVVVILAAPPRPVEWLMKKTFGQPE